MITFDQRGREERYYLTSITHHMQYMGADLIFRAPIDNNNPPAIRLLCKTARWKTGGGALESRSFTLRGMSVSTHDFDDLHTMTRTWIWKDRRVIITGTI